MLAPKSCHEFVTLVVPGPLLETANQNCVFQFQAMADSLVSVIVGVTVLLPVAGMLPAPAQPTQTNCVSRPSGCGDPLMEQIRLLP